MTKVKEDHDDTLRSVQPSEHQKWLDQVQEEIIEPNQLIIDPHHHLWPASPRTQGIPQEQYYLLEDLWKDTCSGHNISKTVFVECGQGYYEEGPEAFRPVGETEFVVKIAKESNSNPSKAQIAGIVSHADMMLGDSVKEVLEAHVEKGEGLFRGIRHAGGWDDSEEVRNSHSNPIKKIYLNETFQRGIEQLDSMKLTFDSWHYHNQIKELTQLAKAFPNLTIIHDHFGGPLGIGQYEDKREAIFYQWQEDISELATCKNVYSKLGGMAMPINGWDWHKRNKPASSDELVEAQKDYYLHSIKVFGTQRCMFESNFPVDKQSISYPVLWNGLKKLSMSFSLEEKNNLFFNTAKRVYSL